MSMEDILSSVEFQVSLLLFVALGGYLLASRINQSAVVGEILVGLVVGPSFLGLITYTDLVASLATMGAIILLFVIGFEFNFTDVLNPRYVVIALVGVIIPWIGGYATALLFGPPSPRPPSPSRRTCSGNSAGSGPLLRWPSSVRRSSMTC
jgi:Kef-type K+ transport system membrane component KefB